MYIILLLLHIIACLYLDSVRMSLHRRAAVHIPPFLRAVQPSLSSTICVLLESLLPNTSVHISPLSPSAHRRLPRCAPPIVFCRLTAHISSLSAGDAWRACGGGIPTSSNQAPPSSSRHIHIHHRIFWHAHHTHARCLHTPPPGVYAE